VVHICHTFNRAADSTTALASTGTHAAVPHCSADCAIAGVSHADKASGVCVCSDKPDRTEYTMKKLARQRSMKVACEQSMHAAEGEEDLKLSSFDEISSPSHLIGIDVLMPGDDSKVLKEGPLKKRIVTRTVLWVDRHVTLTQDELLISVEPGGETKESIMLLDISECSSHVHEDPSFMGMAALPAKNEMAKEMSQKSKIELEKAVSLVAVGSSTSEKSFPEAEMLIPAAKVRAEHGQTGLNQLQVFEMEGLGRCVRQKEEVAE
jgi:hypothetical protein